jgi:hypothetical protein
MLAIAHVRKELQNPRLKDASQAERQIENFLGIRRPSDSRLISSTLGRHSFRFGGATGGLPDRCF